MHKKISSALISVFHKEGLDEIIKELRRLDIRIYSTGGTKKYIEEKGADVTAVESVTGYPSILGGRVKTLHPKVFGGILARQQEEDDRQQIGEYDIPVFDLVIVDLYPFEETVAGGGSEEEIIEKIDIGGISLIRAAAKNFKDILIIPSGKDYNWLEKVLKENEGKTSLDDRKLMAGKAFSVSAHYDTAIRDYFNGASQSRELRYGENPHQKGWFHGKLEDAFDQLHGKELSYNNLVDIDAAVHLISEFDRPTIGILKHTNPCGLATRGTLQEAWKDALAGDPVSVFGGIIISNKKLDRETASKIHELFVEVVIAPDFSEEALNILKQKKNRILLQQKLFEFPETLKKTILNGDLEQDRDQKADTENDMSPVTKKKPDNKELKDLVFANKAVKHLKSNAIALVKNEQLIGIGCGQTSRVDALKQAIAKAKHFNLELKGAVMASDAFFPFADCVEIADNEGIKLIVQPGGSVRDQESIDYCDQHEMAMVFTGTRHFKH